MYREYDRRSCERGGYAITGVVDCENEEMGAVYECVNIRK